MTTTLLHLDYPMVLIGVDPGGTTGVSVYGLNAEDTPAFLLDSIQWGDPDTVSTHLQALVKKWRDASFNVVLIIEQFDKRPGIVEPDYSSMYIIRDIERDMPNETIVWFTPSQAKNLVKPAHKGAPDGLKKFGWYKVGMGHANDASRHVIVFLVERLHHMPTILRGWPKR